MPSAHQAQVRSVQHTAADLAHTTITVCLLSNQYEDDTIGIALVSCSHACQLALSMQQHTCLSKL